jgi:hypothetical protein
MTDTSATSPTSLNDANHLHADDQGDGFDIIAEFQDHMYFSPTDVGEIYTHPKFDWKSHLSDTLQSLYKYVEDNHNPNAEAVSKDEAIELINSLLTEGRQHLQPTGHQLQLEQPQLGTLPTQFFRNAPAIAAYMASRLYLDHHLETATVWVKRLIR